METQQSRKGGEVGAFYLDKEETTSKVLKPLKKQAERFSTNAKPYPKAWQRKETIEKLLTATPTITLHQSVIQNDNKLIADRFNLTNEHFTNFLFMRFLTPLRQELANLPVEPFFLTFRQLFKTEEKANNL